jgi:hypothetical protein
MALTRRIGLGGPRPGIPARRLSGRPSSTRASQAAASGTCCPRLAAPAAQFRDPVVIEGALRWPACTASIVASRFGAELAADLVRVARVGAAPLLRALPGRASARLLPRAAAGARCVRWRARRGLAARLLTPPGVEVGELLDSGRGRGLPSVPWVRPGLSIASGGLLGKSPARRGGPHRGRRGTRGRARASPEGSPRAGDPGPCPVAGFAPGLGARPRATWRALPAWSGGAGPRWRCAR